MNVHKSSLKLAGFYLVIMMAISLSFSISLYRVSVQDFDNDLHRQSQFLNNLSQFGVPPPTRMQFLHDRQNTNQQAKQNLLAQLVLVNVIILVGGGLLSYYLARQTLKPIEETHESQSRFTADASHELRTPIAAMQTETEVTLMDPTLTLEQAKNQLKSNLEELSKLTSLTENLLRLASSSDNELTTATILLGSVIDKAVEQVLPKAEAKQILLNVHPAKAITIQADEASLKEALINILDNAVKYSPDKTEVFIKQNRASNWAYIHIIDHGIGMAPDELPHIFDRFYRADSARSKQMVGGYGLGLAIAKNVIDINGGKISASSQVGQGTTFTIQLPLADKASN